MIDRGGENLLSPFQPHPPLPDHPYPTEEKLIHQNHSRGVQGYCATAVCSLSLPLSAAPAWWADVGRAHLSLYFVQKLGQKLQARSYVPLPFLNVLPSCTVSQM